MNIILVDTEVREQLLPVTFTRPAGDIRVGAFTIREKWAMVTGAEVSFLTLPYLSGKFPTIIQKENVYIDGTVFPTPELLLAINELKYQQALVSNGKVIAFVTGQIQHDEIKSVTDKFEWILFNGAIPKLSKSWDIISFLKHALVKDLEYLLNNTKSTLLPEHIQVVNPEKIRAGKNVILENCILNASHGPIYIDDEAQIMDGAILRGPVYIGKHSIVKMGAKIYGPFATGEHCRIGGEVTDSLFQAFSNKGHDGFLGHSYLGEWCNLGADTNISNLKNSYDNVRMWNYVSQRFEHTGMQFLGVIMGDHSKTAINTMINSGTIVGVSCSIYGSDFPRNFVPSFTQGGARKLTEFPLPQSLKTAEAVLLRRNRSLTELEIALLSAVYNQTKPFRRFI